MVESFKWYASLSRDPGFWRKWYVQQAHCHHYRLRKPLGARQSWRCWKKPGITLRIPTLYHEVIIRYCENKTLGGSGEEAQARHGSACTCRIRRKYLWPSQSLSFHAVVHHKVGRYICQVNKSEATFLGPQSALLMYVN